MLRPLMLFVFALAAASAQAQAPSSQPWPEHPVRVMVGFTAGSGPDLQARTIAAQLQNDLKQSFFIENRLGANGTIAARAVTQAAPDATTMLFSSSSITPTPYIYKNLGYDTLTDLRPVATSGILDGMLMLVDGKSPIRTLPQFIEHAKKQRVLYGSPGVGNLLHLAAEVFSQKAGVTLQHVPYKGASEVTTALLAGNVHVMFVTPPSVIGLVKEGKVRAIAFTGTQRFPEFPEVPLMKDMLPGYKPMGSWGMFFLPGKTPLPVAERMNAAVREALKKPEVAKIMARDGYVPDNRTAAQTAAFFKSEVEAMGEAVKAAKIEPN
jgi:tripartite-type tricarboxylate transporter receptor subunit TctC